MPDFRVLWEIDLTAATPRAAARLARDIQLDIDSTAAVFIVTSSVDTIAQTVDLAVTDPPPR
ncbi:hypothetical protein HLB23_28725 [Nocardia uniformis]|uniref:Uncharacterized protein n=1 Tax=Nocardia uniformis TaxID=53432 RepID=A0A849C584_9NOCA|nr:hypothetical protein [Nocardia uniformis]NNH73792.1 hypothetical protein [Nocardia uniformis]